MRWDVDALDSGEINPVFIKTMIRSDPRIGSEWLSVIVDHCEGVLKPWRSSRQPGFDFGLIIKDPPIAIPPLTSNSPSRPTWTARRRGWMRWWRRRSAC